MIVSRYFQRSLSSDRIGLIDALRGGALIAMATYHFSWDLEFFGYLEPGTVSHGPLKLYARAIATSFLFLAGVSLVLANRDTVRWRSFGRRWLMIAAAALTITVVTRIATPGEFIHFGILHAMALFSLVGLLFLRAPPLVTLVAAVPVILLPMQWQIDGPDSPALWWTGLLSHPPRSSDFVPFFPWFAPFQIGMAAAQLAVRHGLLERLMGRASPNGLLARLGQRSLTFYLLHQPVLFSLVYLASLVIPAPPRDISIQWQGECVQSCLETNGEPLCTAFCSCTLHALKDQHLFEGLTKGTINGKDDPRVSAIAGQCTNQALDMTQSQ